MKKYKGSDSTELTIVRLGQEITAKSHSLYFKKPRILSRTKWASKEFKVNLKCFVPSTSMWTEFEEPSSLVQDAIGKYSSLLLTNNYNINKQKIKTLKKELQSSLLQRAIATCCPSTLLSIISTSTVKSIDNNRKPNLALVLVKINWLELISNLKQRLQNLKNKRQQKQGIIKIWSGLICNCCSFPW